MPQDRQAGAKVFGLCELVETEGDRRRGARPERHVHRQLAGKPKPISEDATGGNQAQAGCERRRRLQRGGKLGAALHVSSSAAETARSRSASTRSHSTPCCAA